MAREPIGVGDDSRLPRRVREQLAAEVADDSTEVGAAVSDTIAGSVGALNDPAVAGLIDDPESDTRDRLNATIDGQIESSEYIPAAIAPARLRAAESVRGDSRPRAWKRFTPPAGFDWTDAPINIYWDGYHSFKTDFDVTGYRLTGGTTYYVDPVSGNSSFDGLTPETAKASLGQAVTAASSGDTIEFANVVEDQIIYRSGGLQGVAINKSLNIVSPVPVRIVYADDLTFTATGGTANVWQTTRSSVNAVADFDPEFGRAGYRYTNVDSVAECQALPGSWHQSGTTLYVHALHGGEPDSAQILAFLGINGDMANSSTANVTLYMENIHTYGGFNGLLLNAGANEMNFYAYRCGWHWTTGGSGSADALNADGCDRVYLQECESFQANKDGFNYTAYADNGATLRRAPKFIEVDCTSGLHGIMQSVAGSTKTNNASTAHTGAQGIRVGGEYFETTGSVIADVQTGTQSLNLDVNAHDSLIVGDVTAPYAASAISAGQAGAEVWVYGGAAFGCESDVFAEVGATVHTSRLLHDTSGGGGTLDLVASR